MASLDELWERVHDVEKRIVAMEEAEARRLAILSHMRRHRVQQYLREKLGGRDG